MGSIDRRYLGDGVYAYHDGYHVWLTTERENGEHRIALEPPVLVALQEYVEHLSRPQQGRESGEET